MRQGLRDSRTRRRNPFARARFFRVPFRDVHGRGFGRHVRPFACPGHLSGILSMSRSDRTPPNRHRKPVGRTRRSPAGRYSGKRRRSGGTPSRSRRNPTVRRRRRDAARGHFAVLPLPGGRRPSRAREKLRRLRLLVRMSKRDAHPLAERYRMINLTIASPGDIFAKFSARPCENVNARGGTMAQQKPTAPTRMQTPEEIAAKRIHQQNTQRRQHQRELQARERIVKDLAAFAECPVSEIPAYAKRHNIPLYQG